jgi:hypothetical protein
MVIAKNHNRILLTPLENFEKLNEDDFLPDLLLLRDMGAKIKKAPVSERLFLI